MIIQHYKDIVTDELLNGNIDNDEFTGFLEDYRVLHCLLRIFKPKSVFEIGCNMGVGTKIIKNAVPDAEVYSLDLPTELAHISLQHPINEGKGDSVGHRCDLPFTLLRGDSMNFDYSQYPCEAYFVDGSHDFEHVSHETKEIIKLKPLIIIYHDSDIKEVFDGIVNGMNDDYELYRVIDTRIAYLKRKW